MDVGCGINCGDPRLQIDWTYELSQKGDGVILADEKSQGMSSESQRSKWLHIHPAQSFQHNLTNFADNCFTQFMCRNLQFSKTELHFARDNARRDSWRLVKTSSWWTKYIQLKYWKKYSIIKRTSSVNQWKVFTELSFSYLVSQQHLSWVKPRQAQKQTLDTPLRQDCCHMGLWRYCTCMWQALA